MLDVDELAKTLSTTAQRPHLVVPLGDAANRFYASGDSDRSFYLLGAMGMSLPTALGIAIGTPRPVLAIEGDGGLLMNVGILTTVARYKPHNLSVVILDNGSYATTGGQPTSFKFSRGIEALIRAAGNDDVKTFNVPGSEAALATWVTSGGPRFAIAEIAAKPCEAPFVPLAPTFIRHRFMGKIAHNPSHQQLPAINGEVNEHEKTQRAILQPG